MSMMRVSPGVYRNAPAGLGQAAGGAFHSMSAPAGTRPMGAMTGYGAPSPITQPMGANMNTTAHGFANPRMQGRPMAPINPMSGPRPQMPMPQMPGRPQMLTPPSPQAQQMASPYLSQVAQSQGQAPQGYGTGDGLDAQQQAAAQFYGGQQPSATMPGSMQGYQPPWGQQQIQPMYQTLSGGVRGALQGLLR